MREFYLAAEVGRLGARVAALELQVSAFLPSADHETDLPQTIPPPDPEWVRGRCPLCDGAVVSNVRYIERKGYIIVWECWNGLQASPNQGCQYRRVL